MSRDYSFYTADLQKRISELGDHMRNSEWSQAERAYWSVNHSLTQVYGAIRAAQANKMSNRE